VWHKRGEYLCCSTVVTQHISRFKSLNVLTSSSVIFIKGCEYEFKVDIAVFAFSFGGLI